MTKFLIFFLNKRIGTTIHYIINNWRIKGETVGKYNIVGLLFVLINVSRAREKRNRTKLRLYYVSKKPQLKL